MNKPIFQSGNPVPLEKHYEVFKNVELRIHRRLGSLDHEYFPVGMRVAYDEKDSSSEPGVLPYSIEFGYLGPVDEASQCSEEQELGEEELLEAAKSSPIPVELLDELYSYVKSTLESEAGRDLRVGIAFVLTGSTLTVASSTCACNNKTRKKYCYTDPVTKKKYCYCTTNPC